MTSITAEQNPSVARFLLWKLTSAYERNASRRGVSSNAASMVIRYVLQIAGFALLTMAGFTFSMIAGLIVAGISCFVLSTLMTNGGSDATVNRR